MSDKRLHTRFLDRVGTLSLEQGFIIFSVVYLPFALLLSNQGVLAESMLAIYTLALMVTAMVLAAKFLMVFAKHANDRSGQYGTLLIMYVLDLLIPMIMGKVFGFVILQAMPVRHYGLVCEIVNFVRGLMYTFQYQRTLNILILSTLAAFVLFALWNVGRSNK